MKKKSIIFLTILFLTIGFAAISTTLIINGNAKVGENVDDFDIIFTNAIMDYNDIYAKNTVVGIVKIRLDKVSTEELTED